MARVFLFVLDSFGIGNAPDAERYGDLGADTLGISQNFAPQGQPIARGFARGR